MNIYSFTQNQFDEIKSLLRKRLIATSEDQKKIRAKIRKLGFMISNHHNGFSDIDFQNLYKSGVVKILQEEKSIVIPKKEFKPKSFSKTSSENLKKSLPFFADKKTSILILGTMPGEKSLFKQEYYTNPSNNFWEIISIVFNGGKPFKDYSEKLEVLKSNNIGLWDVLKTCNRNGSLDSEITNQFSNDFQTLFDSFPNINTVIFNGKESFNYFKPLCDKFNKQYLVLSSTSSTNTHKKANEKVEEWKAKIF